MSDGGLRKLFQTHLPMVHWQPTEMIGSGCPDMNGCLNGKEFWIENKATTGWAVVFQQATQIAWIERRIRAGGRCFIAVRRQGSAKGVGRDELWLFDGSQARHLMEHGLKLTLPLGQYPHGPAKWCWDEIKRNLLTYHAP